MLRKNKRKELRVMPKDQTSRCAVSWCPFWSHLSWWEVNLAVYMGALGNVESCCVQCAPTWFAPTAGLEPSVWEVMSMDHSYHKAEGCQQGMWLGGREKQRGCELIPPSCLHSGAVWPWCHLWGWFPRLRKRKDVSNSVCPLSVEALPLNYFQMCSLIVPRNLQVRYVLCLITNHSSKISGVKSEYFL